MADTSAPSTTSTASVKLGLDTGLVRSMYGILMIAELSLGLIAWCILVSFDKHGLITAIGFAKFCFIFTWLCLLILFFALLFGFHGLINLPWDKIQIILHASFTVLMMIGSIIGASTASEFAKFGRRHSGLTAAVVFGFLLVPIFLASTVYAYRAAYNRFPCT